MAGMHFWTPVLGFSFAFFTNLPMGYWRSISRKFSRNWFLAVHLSVPFIFLMRLRLGLGYGFIPLFVVAAVTGQILGGKYLGRFSGRLGPENGSY